MQKHCIDLKWSHMGKGLLTQGKTSLVKPIHVCQVGPCILTWTTFNLSPRTFAIINARVVKPNSLLSDQFLNFLVIPAIQIVTKHVNTIVQFV